MSAQSRRNSRTATKLTNTAWLGTTWNGPAWIPADVRAGLARTGYTEPGDDVVHYIRKITAAAIAADIPLDSLWSATGPLRIAVDRAQDEKNSKLTHGHALHLPHLSGPLAKQVYLAFVQQHPAQLSAPAFVEQSPAPDFASDDGYFPERSVSPTTFFTPEPFLTMDETINAGAKKRKLDTSQADIDQRQQFIKNGLTTASLLEMKEFYLQSTARFHSAQSVKAAIDQDVLSIRAKMEATQELVGTGNNQVTKCEQRFTQNQRRRDSGIADMDEDDFAAEMENEMSFTGRAYINALRNSTRLTLKTQNKYKASLEEAEQRQREAETVVSSAKLESDAIKILIEDISGLQDIASQVSHADADAARLEEEARLAKEKSDALRAEQRDRIEEVIGKREWEDLVASLEKYGWEKYTQDE